MKTGTLLAPLTVDMWPPHRGKLEGLGKRKIHWAKSY